jgi:hypothetical protein
VIPVPNGGRRRWTPREGRSRHTVSQTSTRDSSNSLGVKGRAFGSRRPDQNWHVRRVSELSGAPFLIFQGANARGGRSGFVSSARRSGRSRRGRFHRRGRTSIRPVPQRWRARGQQAPRWCEQSMVRPDLRALATHISLPDLGAHRELAFWPGGGAVQHGVSSQLGADQDSVLRYRQSPSIRARNRRTRPTWLALRVGREKDNGAGQTPVLLTDLLTRPGQPERRGGTRETPTGLLTVR